MFIIPNNFSASLKFFKTKCGRKQKQTPNLAKPNNLRQVFKDGKKTIKQRGKRLPLAGKGQEGTSGWLAVSSCSAWLVDTPVFALGQSDCTLVLRALLHLLIFHYIYKTVVLLKTTLRKAELRVWCMRGSHGQIRRPRAAQPRSSELELPWVLPATQCNFWRGYTIITARMYLSCQTFSQLGCYENTPNFYCRLIYLEVL